MKSPLNVDIYKNTGKKVKDLNLKLVNKVETAKSYLDEKNFSKTLQMKVAPDKNKTLYDKVTKKFLNEKVK
jgi:hypothetical protein